MVRETDAQERHYREVIEIRQLQLTNFISLSIRQL